MAMTQNKMLDSVRLFSKAVKPLVINCHKFFTNVIVTIALVAITTLSMARPLPNEVTHIAPQLNMVGEGHMTWFGFSIYHASLWTSDGEFRGLKETNPIALHITYDKHISRDKLVEATIDQWEHLEIFESEQRLAWGNELANIWPDVKPGDSITTLITPAKLTIFYANDKLVGYIDEAEFGTALLAIWLHPHTTAPELRTNLIGFNRT